MIDDNLEGWAIVVTNGVRLVGRYTSQVWQTGQPRTLSPVYELRPVGVMQQAAPNRPPIIVCGGDNLSAPLGFESLDTLDVPEGAMVVPLAKMAAGERAQLAKGIDEFEKLKAQRRSNLVIASADALNGQAAKLRVPG
jgi:hypothetical protein